jgi:hypothetical protein
MLVIPVPVKYDSSVKKTFTVNVESSADSSNSVDGMRVLRVHCVAVTLAQTEWRRATAAVLIMYDVEKKDIYY